MEKPKVFTTAWPPDVYKILIREQAMEKIRRNRGQFSIEATAILIIKKWSKGIMPENISNEHNNQKD